MSSNKRKRVEMAHARVALAERQLFDLSMADPRFPGALAEWRNALEERKAAEDRYAQG